ncbi:MAG: ABC transporter substrate-binding protein [Chloroflexi bacterium]|nr:MAG: ABC transporter substrate-binding protein [Chloroflexota bacterium]
MRMHRSIVGAAVAVLIVGACQGASSPAASPSSSAAASASAGGSPAGSAGTAVLRVARLADAYNFFHPVEFQTGNQFQWYNCIFDTLVKVQDDSKTLTDDLAKTWDVSPDASVYTFHLASGVKWQDGQPFTADDLIYTATWGAQNYDAYKGFLPVWNQLKGAAGVLHTSKPLPGLKKIDDSTVEMTLEAPNSLFLVQLTDAANVIVPQHLLKDVTAANVEKVDFTLGKPGATIGTGPYKLTAFTPDQSLELTANPDYFKGAPKIPKIIFKIFADPSLAVAQLESGDLDLAFRVPPSEFDRLSALPNLNVLSAANPGIVRIVFRTEEAPWSDKRVRQAFYYAINRQGIVDQYYKGRAKVLINPPGFKEYDDLNKYAFNVDKAKQLLSDAGYSGQTFKLMYDQTFPDAAQVMPLIQADLQNAGIKVELVPLDTATYGKNYGSRQGWDGFIAVGGSEALTPNKSEQYFPKDGKHESGYTNPRIYELWAAARSTPDAAKQDESYHELAKILNEDVPQVNLYSPNLVMVSTKRLDGGFKVHLNERETFMNVETWTLQ